MSFAEWLIGQQGRLDAIGELALTLRVEAEAYTPPERKVDEHKKWTDVVIGLDKSEHIFVFNDAWQEFLVAKEAAAESAE